ncbi:MAG: ABC transporter ATP-binding protein [Deltaproteobacteria bacterium]|nr:ABC transporter ATP-binding protein [Deltaproteobacteria bacterium]
MPDTSRTAISIQALKKKYKQVEALRGVDLQIPTGEFFGLLGPNGAGKTTLIKSIVGLVRATSGTLRVFDYDVQRDYLKAKAMIGLSPQEPNIDRYFTVRRTLEFQGGYYGLSRKERRRRATELMEQFGIADKENDEYWKLSGGLQKRVLIARALLTSPKILILDEPTAGVDVEQRHELWHHLKNLNKDGTTILLTTHYIDEAEELCNRVAIMNRGQIVEMGEPKTLIRKYCQEQTKVYPGSLEEVFLKVTGKSIHEDQSLKNGKD